MSNTPMQDALKWMDMPELDPETERQAALDTIDFLQQVKARVAKELKLIKEGKARADGLDLHEIWDFSNLRASSIDFLLATLGAGEVRITLYGGEAKVADTSVPGLWRMQMGRENQHNSFVLGRLPRTVVVTAQGGQTQVPNLVNPGTDVFAAPAILNELNHELRNINFDELSDQPAYMVELMRQPLSPGDYTALFSTLGKGDIEVELNGFAKARLTLTGVRGIWHSIIRNNADKTLLDAYVVAGIPPEVPISVEEFEDTMHKCDDLIEWVQHDLDRGVIGAPRKPTEFLNG